MSERQYVDGMKNAHVAAQLPYCLIDHLDGEN